MKAGIREVRNRFITWLDKDTGLPRAGGYYPVSSGVHVTEETALRVTAVFACVRILATTFASMPLHVYHRLSPRGKERAPDHPLYWLLHERPNSEQTSYQFRALLGVHKGLWGNGYAEIEFDNWGNPIALWPIPPWRCEPRRTDNKRELYYEVTLVNGEQKNLAPYRVLHFMGMSVNGDKGLSPIAMAREAIGLSMAAETFGASFFGHGLNPGGIAKHPTRLSPEAYTRLKEELNEKYEGLGKAHRLLLLEEGMTYEKVGINPEEAQFLETRRFQVADIARLYGVPPHMIGDTEKSTSWGTGIEQQGIGFVVYSMRPDLVSFEQELTKKLFSREDQWEFFPEFVVDGLLRGDIKSRYAAYAVGRQWGWLSGDDIREMENLNPIPGGDVYMVPLNMMPSTDMAWQLLNEPEGKKKEDEEDEPEGSRSSLTLPIPDAGTLEPIFREAALRIVRREEADIMRQAKKLKPEAFREWLPSFYEEHKKFIQNTLTPAAAVVGFRELPKFSEEFSLKRNKDLSSAADEGLEALQKRFNETRNDAAETIVRALTGGSHGNERNG